VELGTIEAELEAELEEHPYATLAVVAGIGWMLGRTRPWGALLALGGVVLGTALASTVESTQREGLRARRSRSRMPG
jgi:hypothetical protein